MTTTLEVERPTGSAATHHLSRGTSSPLGATPCRDGVNFSVFSRHATGIELLLFDRVDDAEAAPVIPIEPDNRTYHYWHVRRDQPLGDAACRDDQRPCPYPGARARACEAPATALSP